MKVFFIMFYILGALYFTNSTFATDVIPGITGNGPTIQGNVTSSEWSQAVKFDVNFNGGINNEIGTIFVQANGTHIFVGFNYTSSQAFIPVNNTIPLNSATPYNNATHDWLALQFDNNLDQQTIGSVGSPDDVIVVDQYNTTSYDGLANGNTTVPFIADTAYNGTQDSSGVRTNYTEGATTTTGYEFVKPMNGQDRNGSDFNLFQSKILQFKLTYWMNETANATLASAQSTSWFKVMINETGTGVAKDVAQNLHIQMVVSQTDQPKYTALQTVLSDYGYNVTVDNNETLTIKPFTDLLMIILSDTTTLGTASQDTLKSYLELGGKAMIFLSSSSSVSSSVANMFNLSFLRNSVQVPGVQENTTMQTFDVSPQSNLGIFSTPSLVTDQNVTNMKYSGGAFNVTELNNKDKNIYTLSQDYYGYNMFSSNEMSYDQNNNKLIDGNETGNGLSTGVAFDFLKGGRVLLFASDKIVTNDVIIQSENIPMVLKAVPWNTGFTEKINFSQTTLSTHNIDINHSVTLTINMTDVLGKKLSDTQTANVTIDVMQYGGIYKEINVQVNGDSHSETFKMDRQGYYIVEIKAFVYGSGFAESQRLNLHVTEVLPSLNDLSKIHPVMFTIFFVTLVLAVFVAMKRKK